MVFVVTSTVMKRGQSSEVGIHITRWIGGCGSVSCQSLWKGQRNQTQVLGKTWEKISNFFIKLASLPNIDVV